MTRRLSVYAENWPLARDFAIARGRRSAVRVVRAAIAEGDVCGQGEAVPYRRYGENAESVVAAIEGLAGDIADGMTRETLREALPRGAARCALDCALWDFEAKQSGKPVWQLAGLAAPSPHPTAYTLSIDTPKAMARAGEAGRDYKLLKIKLGGRGGLPADLDRLRAIVAARPDARLIVDANEGWSPDDLAAHADALAGFGVLFFEQPVPAGKDGALADIALPFCADESIHDCAGLETLSPTYSWVNIKLDKAGGLTEALAMAEQARAQGRRIMVGCMLATSLSMSPAHLLAQHAEIIDLDGPLWLARDRKHGLAYTDGKIAPPSPALWG